MSTVSLPFFTKSFISTTSLPTGLYLLPLSLYKESVKHYVAFVIAPVKSLGFTKSSRLPLFLEDYKVLRLVGRSREKFLEA